MELARAADAVATQPYETITTKAASVATNRRSRNARVLARAAKLRLFDQKRVRKKGTAMPKKKDRNEPPSAAPPEPVPLGAWMPIRGDARPVKYPRKRYPLGVATAIALATATGQTPGLGEMHAQPIQ